MDFRVIKLTVQNFYNFSRFILHEVINKVLHITDNHLWCSDRLRIRTTSSKFGVLLDGLRDTPPGGIFSSDEIQPRFNRNFRSGLAANRTHAITTNRTTTNVAKRTCKNQADNSQEPLHLMPLMCDLSDPLGRQTSNFAY